MILVLLHTSQSRFFGKCVKMLCFLETTFLGGSESESREVLTGVSRDANTPSLSRFSVKSSNHYGISRKGSPCTDAVSLF